MKKRDLPTRLSYQDAAFTNFERSSMPMNVGSVGIYEGVIPFTKFLDHVDRRIDLVPRYRQRLVDVPFDIAHAAWVDAPDFDLHGHVETVRLPAPGTEAQLAELAGEYFARPLERDKPLWEIRLVEGLNGGRTAHLAKVHHCMVDGIAGVGLLAALLDVEPTPRPTARRRRRPAAARPDPFALFTDAIFDRMIEQLRTNERLALALVDPASPLRGAVAIVRALAAAARYFAVPAPRTPWNMPLTGPKRLAWQQLRLDEVRAVAEALGGTINDAVLATLAGALGRYLRERGASTDGLTLRTLIPVNVRNAHENASLGNRVSFMLAGLPVDERDPVERFNVIHGEVKSLKETGQAAGLEVLASALGMLPAPVHALLGRTLTMPNTLANMVCTNVPGPLAPLYLMGHRMTAHYPWVPLAWRMGMSVAVMSYDKGMYFAFSGDANAPDDVPSIAGHLADAFAELRGRAGVRASAGEGEAEPIVVREGGAMAAVIPDEFRREPARPASQGADAPRVGARGA
jgi:WS/DGAT/MGAT family acyltransferase